MRRFRQDNIKGIKEAKIDRLKELRKQGKSPAESLADYRAGVEATKARLSDIKETQKNTIASRSGLGSFGNMVAAEKDINSPFYKPARAVGGTVSKIGAGIESLGNSKIGGALGSGKFTVGSWLGSAALDTGANALKENGYGTAGAIASTASGALAGASTGAMLGSLFGPGGAAVGAIGGALIGGISTAFSEYQKSESADGLADADADAVGESNRYQSQSLDEQRAMARELRQLREDIGYGNAISARHVSVQETGNRQLSNLQFAQ